MKENMDQTVGSMFQDVVFSPVHSEGDTSKGYIILLLNPRE